MENQNFSKWTEILYASSSNITYFQNNPNEPEKKVRNKKQELTPEQIIQQQNEEQEQLAGEMLGLAQDLKRIHEKARDTIRGDNKVFIGDFDWFCC